MDAASLDIVQAHLDVGAQGFELCTLRVQDVQLRQGIAHAGALRPGRAGGAAAPALGSSVIRLSRGPGVKIVRVVFRAELLPVGLGTSSSIWLVRNVYGRLDCWREPLTAAIELAHVIPGYAVRARCLHELRPGTRGPAQALVAVPGA